MGSLIQFCVLGLSVWCTRASAQAAPTRASSRTATPLCYHARPKPACSAFGFTSFGAYVVLGTDAIDDAPFREVADWGVMANVTGSEPTGHHS